MPWCHECDRFLSPSSVTAAGECPKCGRPVDAGGAKAPSAIPAPTAASARASALPAESDDDDETLPIPWHLKLLAGAVALYLGFRAWQGIEWIVHRF